MLKHKIEEVVEVLDYDSIPQGAVFTYALNDGNDMARQLYYLKCDHDRSVYLTLRVGMVEERAAFVLDTKLWRVVDSIITFNK